MSLLEMQRALARLLTDEEFREGFFAAPGGAFTGYELSMRERASLLAIDKKRVAIHSHLVMHGRIETALAAFPLSARLVRPHLDELAPEHCRRHPPVAGREPAGQAEVRRFFAFLLEEQAAKRRWPAYFEDLLRYEECLFRLGHTAAAAASREHAWRVNAAGSMNLTLERAGSFAPLLGPHTQLLCFEHDIAAVAPGIERGRVPRRVPVESVKVLFFRERSSSAVRSMRLDDLPCRLLGHCDGRRSVAEVIRLIAGEVGAAGDERIALTHGALDLFRTLWEAGAAAFVAGPEEGRDGPASAADGSAGTAVDCAMSAGDAVCAAAVGQ